MPEQLSPPVQPVKVAVLSGVSVSFTSLPGLLKRTVKPVQLSGQFVPLSLATMPLPVPAFITVSLVCELLVVVVVVDDSG